MESSTKITCIVAHIDHGKTTIIDSIIASQGFFSKSLAGELRYLDNRTDEQERGITLKLAPIKLSNGHIFIDTPGHVDFESLIFSSSVLTDNHIIVVDVNEGITPRIYSLIKFLDKSRSILILNKIDKCDDYETISTLLHCINGLLGEEVFEWAKNNVIISSAILCAGICYGKYKFSKKNTLATAFKAFVALDEKIKNKDVDSIVDKYKIKYPNKKSIFSAVMPLADSIFDSIDSLYKTSDCKILSEDLDSLSISQGPERSPESLHFSLNNNLYSIDSAIKPNLLGISVYSILKEKNQFFKENLLFVTKIFFGKIAKGDVLFCINNETIKEVKVENIYEFSIDEFNEVECSEGLNIICLRGDFLKNSVISTVRLNFTLKAFLTPFYKSKVLLEDFNQLEDMKKTIRVMSFTEPNLKAKVNKFGELEFRCSGNVQFEKICFDLELCGFRFSIKEPEKEFREYSKCTNKHVFINDSSHFEIVIGPTKSFNSENSILTDAFGPEIEELDFISTGLNNIYLIESSSNSHIIESVLDVFTDSGPLIKEKIVNTFFCIKSLKEDSNNFFNNFKKELSTAYMEASPSICPLYFNVKLSLAKNYIGVVYTLLQKFNYLMDNEDYNEDTAFCSLEFKIPQFVFNSFVDEVRLKSKGTAYLEITGNEYVDTKDYDYMIDEVRKQKGMYHGEKVIEDPEKQRTLRK